MKKRPGKPPDPLASATELARAIRAPQLVAKRWNESRLLANANAIANVTGPFGPPPDF